MRIDGIWALFDDGVRRPIIHGEIQDDQGMWVKAPFLVDTGADRTVFSAAILSRLGLPSMAMPEGISGVGGQAGAVIVTTQVRLTHETTSKVAFRGQFAAVTALEALDISVLGRDIARLFAVVVDQAGNIVCLLGQRHRYLIVQD